MKNRTSAKYSVEYVAWQNMIYRCTRKNNYDYKNYGQRGIKVCDRWLSSFALIFRRCRI